MRKSACCTGCEYLITQTGPALKSSGELLITAKSLEIMIESDTAQQVTKTVPSLTTASHERLTNILHQPVDLAIHQH
jgi:hypothetical protein